MKFFYTAILASLFSSFAIAQVPCGQHIIEAQMRAEDPQLDQRFDSFHEEVFSHQEGSATRADLRIIPVVFHIIHNNGPENISDAQIYDAMRILNHDYAATNDEITEVVGSFIDNIGVGDMEFRLATKDPNGNPTNGIDRIQSMETYVGDDGSKLNPWPRDEYLNIWVTDVIYIGGAAAYAYRPPAADNNPSADGVISNHRYVGTIGTASNTGGKTLTHEIGHYLGLPHTWGETNAPGCDGTNQNEPCNGANNCLLDDGISDTPNCLGVSNGGCDLNRTTCGSLDNVQNFMDYASCEAMFTKGQVNVMRNVLNNNLAERNQLWTTSNLNSTGVSKLTAAKFFTPSRAVCANDSVPFFDESTYGATSWEWTFEGPNATYTSNEENPIIVFKQAGIYNITLNVSNGTDSESIIENGAIVVSPPYGTAAPFSDDFSEDVYWITYNNEESSTTNIWKYNTSVGNGDDRCFQVSNLGAQSNRNDDLIFASLDARPMTKVNITFDVAYAQIGAANDDKLTLEVSADCGSSWRTVWSRSGSNLAGSTPFATTPYVPDPDDWETFGANNLPIAWFSGNTFIRFRFTSGGGNNLYLDNVNITGDYGVIPFLVYPDNGTQEMNEDVVLDWQAVNGATSYEYQLDVSSSFKDQVQSGTKDYIDDQSNNEDTEFATSGLTHGQTYYWRVRAAVDGNTSAWSDVWSFTVANDGVGISEREDNNDLNVYPNPATDRLIIEFRQPTAVQSYRILSIDGQVVLEQNQGNAVVSYLEVPLQELAAGTYLVQLDRGNQTDFVRFVVTKK